ncbi:MAG TPA: adenylate/guanylate cyclase domain-containing protein [Candidatus Methylomirabilis sp.]|nr:adenylate/guanylate cyclase domain-containing protein [Candidatus Methylomirabilis sp.]
MKCPRCQSQNREGIRFCEECGSRLALTCANCGAEMLPDKRFCGSCGTPAAATGPPTERYASPQGYTPKHLADKILTTRGSLEGERKQVTVLFADLKGSMELLADRDPEEARRLLDPVLERMMEAVHRYEGTVNQVMGDGIMALFGAPLAHEDHAVRACRAAVRMQETVGAYAEGLRRAQGLDVQIRVGLNSGEVVVRAIDTDLHMDYSAIGQTTHLAARMEQLARPGTTLLTAETLRLAEGYVEVRSMGPVPVKGLPQPVEIHELVRFGPVRSRLQAAAVRGLTPFVGREREVDKLREVRERAAAGHGQIVAIAGEPGVGKSRLVWEFTHAHRITGWRVFECTAMSHGKTISYLPVSDMLKGYFEIDEGDDELLIQEKVTGKLATLDETLRPALPVFLQLLDVAVEDPEWQLQDPNKRRQRTLDAVKRLLLRESQIQPVLLIFESLHWVDSETQAFLDSLVDSLPTARALLLVSYRPEYQHNWGSKTYYTQFRIDPLPAASAEEFLHALLGDDPGLRPLKQTLIGRTEGNPFFLEECVRTLVETRSLTGEPGAYRLGREVQAIQMPATVQAVLAARIDRLPLEGRRLLQAAAVIGMDVPLNLLEAIMDAPEEALRQGLAHLQSAEFLYEVSLFPTVEYTFKHALTQDVAYSTLLQERRRQLHARIVAAIERLHADRLTEHVERLAHHALRGEVWDKAVTYLRQAGAKAAARAANREAVILFEQALVAVQHLPEGRPSAERAIDVRLDLWPPLLQLGQLERVLQLSREAEVVAEKLGDDQRLARVYTHLINYHYLKGEPELAVEYGERCLRIGDSARDPALQARARGYLGYSYHAQGAYRRAEHILKQNVEALDGAWGQAEGPQTGVSFVTSAGWLAFTLAELGEFDAATGYLDRAQRAGEVSGHAYTHAIARSLAGLVWLRRGQLDRALPLLQKSLDACREKNLDVWRPIPSSLLGLTCILLGRQDEGLRLLEDGVALTEALGVRAYLALWTTHLGEGLLVAGQVERAGAVAQRALDLAQAHKERGHQAWALRLLGDVAAASHHPDADAAVDSYTQALALAEELEMRPLAARTHVGLGQLHARAGRRDKSQEHLGTALQMLRAMDIRFWAARTTEELMGLGNLFIVARDNVELYDYLKREFAGEPVTVLLDRRQDNASPRSESTTGPTADGDRRRRTDVEEGLRLRGFAVVARDL